MTARQVLEDALALLGVTGLSWAFHLYTRVLPTSGVIACWVIFTALAAAGLWRQGRVRRQAFLAAYVAGGSPLQRMLRGGPLMAARALLLGGMLAVALMLSLARIDDVRVWLALIATPPALVLLRAWLHRRIGAHASPVFLPLLSWRAGAFIIGAALVVLLAWLALDRAYPDFTGVSLERAVWHMVDREVARSAPWEATLQGMAAADGLRLWLAQQLMPAPGASALQLFGWLLVLAQQALFTWSYLLCGYGVLAAIGALDRDRR
jgi:hypothetical protein